MSKEEEQLQSSNMCWICELIENDDVKIRDQGYITGKFRGAAHWSGNNILMITWTLLMKQNCLIKNIFTAL